MKKNYILEIIVIVLLLIILSLMIWYYIGNKPVNNRMNEGMRGHEMMQEGNTEDEAKINEVDVSSVAISDSKTYINVSEDFSVNGEGAVISDNQITINKSGNYIIEGEADNISIVIDAQDAVYLYLNGTNLTNKSGAVILAKSASMVKIIANEDTTNIISDSKHTGEYDGAIFSLVPLIIEGEGNLVVNGNNEEGIASNSTLTINSGNIKIVSADDGLNSDDGIIINDGDLYILAGGDGIDSNSDIIINGGTIVSYASNAEGDGGLDVSNVLQINGGTVIATGGTIATPTSKSTQNVIMLSFMETQNGEELLNISSSTSDSILTVKPNKDYKMFLYSSPELGKDTYTIYSGGTVEGETENTIYTGNYTPEYKLQTDTSFEISSIVNIFRNIYKEK